MKKDDDAFAEMLKALRESIEGVNEKIEEMKKELKKKM